MNIKGTRRKETRMIRRRLRKRRRKVRKGKLELNDAGVTREMYGERE